MRTHAIQILYTNRLSTVFIIEGFTSKSVDLELIKVKIMQFYENLYGANNCIVEIEGNMFAVETPDSMFYLTWSWITSLIK